MFTLKLDGFFRPISTYKYDLNIVGCKLYICPSYQLLEVMFVVTHVAFVVSYYCYYQILSAVSRHMLCLTKFYEIADSCVENDEQSPEKLEA